MLAYQMFFSISLQDGWPIKMVEEQYLVNLFHSLVWKLRERDSSDTWKKDFQYIYIYILYIYIYTYTSRRGGNGTWRCAHFVF